MILKNERQKKRIQFISVSRFSVLCNKFIALIYLAPMNFINKCICFLDDQSLFLPVQHQP